MEITGGENTRFKRQRVGLLGQGPTHHQSHGQLKKVIEEANRVDPDNKSRNESDIKHTIVHKGEQQESKQDNSAVHTDACPATRKLIEYSL